MQYEYYRSYSNMLTLENKLKGLDVLGRFSSILDNGVTFVASYLRAWTLIPFWKGAYSKEKEFAPEGAIYFLLD